jgi:hypothetical protein
MPSEIQLGDAAAAAATFDQTRSAKVKTKENYAMSRKEDGGAARLKHKTQSRKSD